MKIKKTQSIKENANVKTRPFPCLAFQCQQLDYLFSYILW